mmetsp:Transcript_36469/g.55757  ORF Transcript_36469/g.55757 Transcript_36469/m.55757 type:complete len:273 (+) Transcript_36469:185-1003(+)
MILKPSLTSTTLAILILLRFLIIPSYGFSGCELCAQFGKCSTAFHNSPGQYCGDWYDYTASHNRPCCCPTDSTCKNSGTSCSCHVSSNYNPSYGPPYRPPSSSSSYSSSHARSEVGIFFASVIFLTIFICCCCCFVTKCIRSCRKSSSSNDYYDPFIATVNPPPLNPQYHDTPITVMPVATAPSYTTYGATTSSSSTGGNATSALGGFAAGTVLGNLVTRSFNKYSGGNNNGGGYDIAGDSGDGGWFSRGETAGGGYDIAADDGGYDIAGDS